MQLGVSQEKMSGMLGVSPRTVRRWEAAGMGHATPQAGRRLALVSEIADLAAEVQGVAAARLHGHPATRTRDTLTTGDDDRRRPGGRPSAPHRRAGRPLGVALEGRSGHLSGSGRTQPTKSRAAGIATSSARLGASTATATAPVRPSSAHLSLSGTNGTRSGAVVSGSRWQSRPPSRTHAPTIACVSVREARHLRLPCVGLARLRRRASGGRRALVA